MKKKDYPKELLIGDNIWKIKFVSLKKHDTKKSICLGLCDPEKKEILIRTGQDYVTTLNTIFHEVLHSLEYEYDIELNHKHVYKLGDAMAQLYIDNASLRGLDNIDQIGSMP